MFRQRESSGDESSSQPARTRPFEPDPAQLDAEHAAAQAGPLDVTQRPAARTSEGRAAALAGPSTKQDTATGAELRSLSPASAPPLAY